MGLKDYVDEMKLEKRNLYVAICICQASGFGMKNPINVMIEDVIGSLKSELNEYKSVFVSYIYEEGGLVGCTEFDILEPSSNAMYIEQVDDDNIQNLDHVFFMGQAMLERKKAVETGECRLYMLTDKKFTRNTNIVWEEDGEIIMNPRFKSLNTDIILMKSKTAGGDLFEEYLKKSMRGKLIVFEGNIE